MPYCCSSWLSERSGRVSQPVYTPVIFSSSPRMSELPERG